MKPEIRKSSGTTRREPTKVFLIRSMLPLKKNLAKIHVRTLSLFSQVLYNKFKFIVEGNERAQKKSLRN
jgi:hypothetical protein